MEEEIIYTIEEKKKSKSKLEECRDDFVFGVNKGFALVEFLDVKYSNFFKDLSSLFERK